MKIVSRFTRTVISKLLKMALRKKLGCEVDIQVNEVRATILEGDAHVHLNADANLTKDELVKLLKNIGLN